MSTPNSQIILYLQATHLLTAFREVLKEQELRDYRICKDEVSCLEALAELPEALLVLDWSLPKSSSLRILSALQNPIKILVRPILLIAGEPEEALSGVAVEYGIMRLMTGAISRNSIKEHLLALLNQEVPERDLNQQLSVVAKARANGEWRAARALLDHLHQSYPEHPRVVAALAENCLFEGRPLEAFSVLESFYDRGTNDVRLLNLLGRCLLKLDRSQDAARLLNAAKVINPYNVERLLELGDVLLECGDYQQAKDQYAQALVLDERNKRAQKGMGKALLVSGDINAALKFLREATGSTECAAIFNTAGVLCVRHGRMAEGLKLYEYAVKSLKVHNALLAKLAFNLGLAHLRKGTPKAALYYFTLASQLDKSYEKANLKIAILSRRLKVNLEIDPSVSLTDRFFPENLAELDRNDETPALDAQLYTEMH